MGLISPFTLIRVISIFHLAVAYFFLTAPKVITDQNMVVVLGEALRLPQVTSLDKPNEASAFIAVLLTFIALSDLVAASLNELVAVEYWLSIVPIRLLFLFGLTGYVYLFKDDGVFGSHSLLSKSTPGELLRTSLVFAFAFAETTYWFWIFTSLRDERETLARRQAERIQAEKDRL